MRTLVASLVLPFFFLCLSPGETLGQDVRLIEIIKIDTTAKIKVAPASFRVTEDSLFLIPEYQSSKMNILSKNENFLRNVGSLGPDFGAHDQFVKPRYCFLSQDANMLGVIDNQAKKTFIFNRRGKVNFPLIKSVACESGVYDAGVDKNNEKLIISGYVIDQNNRPFDLYSLNIGTGEIDYLLESHQKYGLTNSDGYEVAFKQRQTLPAIGTRAFIDVSGDNVFFAWEGALRIIKFDLSKKEVVTTFENETKHYAKPDGTELAKTYKVGNFNATWEKQKEYSYVTNIFATDDYVFLIYETNKGNSNFRLQTYSPEGVFVSDVKIPGEPGHQMCLDKDKYELYAFSKSGNGEFSILKYNIK